MGLMPKGTTIFPIDISMVPWKNGVLRKMCGLSPNFRLFSTSMTMGGRVLGGSSQLV